jgi:sulfur carrier protein
MAAIHAREAGVNVTLNGESREVRPGTTVAELVSLLTEQTAGVAAAVNGEVLPRRAWAGTSLADRDQVEVVTAVQGG